MIANLLKYILIIENPKLQISILLTFILSSDSEHIKKIRAASFVVQALCIDAIAIISVLSGTPLFLVVVGMLAQGGYLIIDAYRDRNPEKYHLES